MKLRTRERPIGKCKGCCLNLRTVCAAGLEPKTEWDRGRCRAHNDELLLARFQEPAPATGAKAARQSRRAKAAMARTVPHHDGHIFVPARQAAGGK